jgi:SAM-dependent methyltransferase
MLQPGSEAARRAPSGRWAAARGLIEVAVSESADRVRMAGWVGSCLGPPDAIEAHCDGRPLAIVSCELGLARPDVARHHPTLVDAERCGFRIRLALEDWRQQCRGRLVRLTPLFRGERGLDLLAAPSPRIEPPSFQELQQISISLPVAFEILGYLLEFAQLRPGHAVLDVGCGVGRVAYALAHVLGPEGRYEGFDVSQPAIETAMRRLGALPGFVFRWVDVANGFYNPSGALKGARLSFPYSDRSFDVVVVSSVFTHLRPPDVQHYLAEIRRVLRPGGRALVTAFLVDAEARQAIAEGRSDPALGHRMEGFLVADPAAPEAAIGYDRSELLGWAEARGLAVEAILPGSWCGRSVFTSFQDLMVLR